MGARLSVYFNAVAWNGVGQAQSRAACRRKIGVSALVLLLTAANTYAQHTDDYEYRINGPDYSTVTLTRYTGSDLAVVIPDSIDEKTVTGIGALAFANTSITNVTIPSSVIRIGPRAFIECSGLTSVMIPGSVIDLEENAFSYCSGLTSITIPDSVASIAKGTFLYCSGLTSVTLGDGVDNIGIEAFYGCSSLTNVLLGNAVTNIGIAAFGGCASLIGVKSWWKTGCGETAVTNAALPDSVISIGCGAFSGCAGLRRVSLPSGLTALADSVFEGCSSLVSVTIPAGVSSVGDWAFASCGSLAAVWFTGNAPSAGSDVFSGSANVTVYIRQGTTEWDTTFADRPVVLLPFTYSLTDSAATLTGYTGAGSAVVIPDVLENLPVTGIGDGVFGKCANMTSVRIPESVTNIGFAAFYGCSGLTTIALPEGVVSIGASAFEACWELTAITIPPHVTRIEDGTFGFCRKLTRVELPDGLVFIGVNAFSVCDRLVSVRIPASVTAIDRQAFMTCSALTGLYFLGDAPSFGTGAGPFFEAGNVTVYYLPGATGWGPWVDDRPAVLWNPQVQSGAGFGMRSGQFGFGLTNAGSPVVVIEACTNLAEPVWVPVSTNTLTGGCSAFSDTQTANHPARFYRFRMP